MGEEEDLLNLAGIAAPAKAEGGSWLDITIPLPIRKSSCIATATYGLATRDLTLAFVSGETIVYQNFDIVSVIRFVRAESAGRFYNAEIKEIR